MNYGDREKSTLPDSPIEPYIADWKERRKYALLQPAATIMAALIEHSQDVMTLDEIRELAIEQVHKSLSEIESRLPESAE